jgi:predicted TIM-barrel fold metal-dependent hydrolase
VNDPTITDAHVHTGELDFMFAPRHTPEDLLACMDRRGIRYAVHCGAMADFRQGSSAATLDRARQVFEEAGGRIFYLGVFHPRHERACLQALEAAAGSPGFRGLKIHPSFHGVPGSDPAYRPAWQFAADHDLALLTHSWSVSDYNPVQHLSTPDKFEGLVEDFPGVRFVLGHAGGRGEGQRDAVRMAAQYPNVYLDFAGDIYCYRLLERLVAALPYGKILFGSDFPMFDQNANLTRVLLADIEDAAKAAILNDNAANVYRLGEPDA